MQDTEKIDAFVATNSRFYEDKWRKIQDKPGAMASFNWAACIGQIIWLAYRKLYVPLIWVLVASVAYVSLFLYVDDRQLVSESVSDAGAWLVSLLFFVVFGFFGNYWYWRKYRKIEQLAVARQLDGDAALELLRSRGGTSPLAASALVILLLAPVAWALYWGVYQASGIDYSGFVFDATGPLTLAEIEANFLVFMDEPMEAEEEACVFGEIDARARAAGDPETLDPATVEFLPTETWGKLDPDGKRLILTQAIVTKASFVCRQSSRITPGIGAAEDRAAAKGAAGQPAVNKVAALAREVIVPGDPRFDVFERSNSQGDGTFASSEGTVLLSFRARDSRYCRAARFSSDYTMVLACRGENGWEIEAKSSLAPGQSTVATSFGGGEASGVSAAIEALRAGNELLNEHEIIEAAGSGWQ